MMYIFAFIGLVIMAARSRRRGKRRYPPRDWFALQSQAEEALATLAENAGLLQGLLSSTFTHDARILSVRGTWSIDGLTDGEGPIQVGLAHSDYSLTEVEAWIEQTGLLGPGSMTEREVSGRLIRRVGVLNFQERALNDGKPVKTRLNWLIPDGKGINMWSYNAGDAANLTTGAVVRFLGQLNGYWQY